MTTSAVRPPCPICGEPRCILQRGPFAGEFGKTCGNRRCRAILIARDLGPVRISQIRKGRPRKPPLLTADYNRGYAAGHQTGYRNGLKAGKAAADVSR